MGAVIDDKAFRKIREYIETGKKEGRLVAGGDAKDGGGYFIPPTVIVWNTFSMGFLAKYSPIRVRSVSGRS